jgi:membrane protein YqaA with SNARE-associated domain
VVIGALVVLGETALRVADASLLLPYIALFGTSLLAGTMLPFLPASSEMAMAGMLAMGVGAPLVLVTAAIGGSVFGATVNYVVGCYIARFSAHRWFPISSDRLQKTTEWFRRYGIWLILMCWLPTAGDAITVVAGVLRADLRVFLVLAATGKAFGHVAVAGGVSWIA